MSAKLTDDEIAGMFFAWAASERVRTYPVMPDPFTLGEQITRIHDPAIRRRVHAMTRGYVDARLAELMAGIEKPIRITSPNAGEA